MIVMKWEMPKNCIDCLGKLGPISHCPCKNNFESKHNRHPDCPIIGEIPDEHGDLIDGDELPVRTGFSMDGIERFECVHFDDILNAPVILEASK